MIYMNCNAFHFNSPANILRKCSVSFCIHIQQFDITFAKLCDECLYIEKQLIQRMLSFSEHHRFGISTKLETCTFSCKDQSFFHSCVNCKRTKLNRNINYSTDFIVFATNYVYSDASLIILVFVCSSFALCYITFFANAHAYTFGKQQQRKQQIDRV